MSPPLAACDAAPDRDGVLSRPGTRPPPRCAEGQPKADGPSAPPGSYMGRPIADVMSFAGADWLLRETREEEEQPDKMLDALKIAPGSTVADIGAGVGYTSLRLARRVGPEGTVLATDVQPEMLRMLEEQRQGRRPHQRQAHPRHPDRDQGSPTARWTWSSWSTSTTNAPDPEAILKGLRKALKPGGRLVLVEFRGEDPDVPIRPEHKMTLKQVRRELEPQGYLFKDSLEFLPWQHIIIFENPPADVK